jgi:hypothetical protein
MTMTSKGSCQRVWLCEQKPTDICYRHYHNCYLADGHPGDRHFCGTDGHDSDRRTGDIVTGVQDAYRQMSALGWKP